MSNTIRDIRYINGAGIRIVRFKSTQRSEQKALAEILESGFNPSIRLRNRAASLCHPNEDQTVSALSEVYRG